MVGIISERDKKASFYIEDLLRSLKNPKPFYKDFSKKKDNKSSEINDFPASPGVYVVIRENNLSVNPIVLYVGKTTVNRGIKDRLSDHFRKRTPNVNGSQFCKILMQICQDSTCVMRILWSEKTKIGTVSIENENDEMISRVEELAIQVLKPKLNVIK